MTARKRHWMLSTTCWYLRYLAWARLDGLELGLAVEVREAALMNDGGVCVVRLAVAGETEVIFRAGAVGEVGLAEGVEAAYFV